MTHCKRVQLAAFLVGACLAMSPALSSASPQEPTETTSAPATPQDPYETIELARQKDARGLAERVAKLRTSEALMNLFDGAPSDMVTTHLEFFAATADTETVDTFVTQTEGKHFEFTETKDGLTVTLKDGEAPKDFRGAQTHRRLPRQYKCWKAYFAAYAWFAATSAICGAVGAMTAGTATPACALAFWGVGTLPNWNNACR